MELPNLPIGIQNFEKIRDGNYLYVDKTALVYKLASTSSYYFLSRPRRFGKSLLLSTLHSYFDGRRDLFEGLANAEVEEGFFRFQLPYYTSVNPVDAPFHIQNFVQEIRTGQTEAFLTRLKKFLRRHSV